MISKLHGRVSSAHVIAMVALFVALGGTAFAAATVGTNDIKDGAVTTNKIRNKAVTRQKIANDAVVTPKIRNNAVKTAKIADSAVNSAKIADGSVGTGDLADDAVTEPKIGNDAVTATQIADGSVGSVELGSDSVTASKLPLTVRDTTVDMADGTTALLESPCLAGEVVIGGGATWSAGFSNAQAQGTHLVHSRPNPNLSGWTARAYNGSGASRTFFVRAICVAAG